MRCVSGPTRHELSSGTLRFFLRPSVRKLEGGLSTTPPVECAWRPTPSRARVNTRSGGGLIHLRSGGGANLAPPTISASIRGRTTKFTGWFGAIVNYIVAKFHDPRSISSWSNGRRAHPSPSYRALRAPPGADRLYQPVIPKVIDRFLFSKHHTIAERM